MTTPTTGAVARFDPEKLRKTIYSVLPPDFMRGQGRRDRLRTRDQLLINLRNAIEPLITNALAEQAAALDDLRHDISNAVKCAKEYEPDYPWTLNTASEAVWALGEDGKGTEAAIGDRQKEVANRDATIKEKAAEIERLKAELADARADKKAAIKATLIYYTPGPWNGQEWYNLTQQNECTSKSLCEFLRNLDGKGGA